MKQSELFTKTLREDPADETAVNAKLLERGGFIHKNSAGVYSYLPLGWRVLQNIASLVREEMNAIGGQEIFLPALIEKKYMEPTGRWDVEIGIEAKAKNEKNASFVLGWSHEDMLTAMATRFIRSYKDLPFAAYQIQTKFRHEPRAKSGLLRGREFMMKDLYSFHASQDDFLRYYEEVKKSYFRIFERCGLKAIETLAAGGVFTASNTHEFQVPADVGEDIIYVCEKCGYAENKEIADGKDGGACKKCGGTIRERKSIEVGNIFPLGTKYAEAFNLCYTEKEGKKNYVIMGSYGIGLGRLMGTIVEIHHDEKGIMWPEEVAPYSAHLIKIKNEKSKIKNFDDILDKIYKELMREKGDVLYDDREEVSAGEKFADADLIGIPTRVVISDRTLAQNAAEVKQRNQANATLVPLEKLR